MAKVALPAEMTKEEVCRRLVAARRAMGLSAAQVCRRVGIGTTAWANYEKRARMPNTADMMRVALAFGLPLDYIYMGRQDRLPQDIAPKIADELARDEAVPAIDEIALKRSARLRHEAKVTKREKRQPSSGE